MTAYSSTTFEAIPDAMTNPTSPTSPTSPTPPPHRHSTKPTEESKRAELLAIKRFRDAKELPFSNEDLFKYVGVSCTVGYRIFKDKPRPLEENRGRPRALSKEQVDHLVAFLETEGYEGRTLPWDELPGLAGIEFPTRSKPPSSHTIKKHLNERGWRKCVACAKFWVDHDTVALGKALARKALAKPVCP